MPPVSPVTKWAKTPDFSSEFKEKQRKFFLTNKIIVFSVFSDYTGKTEIRPETQEEPAWETDRTTWSWSG